jgi:hypothetical protein
MPTPREIAEAVLEGRPLPSSISAAAAEVERALEAAIREDGIAVELVNCEWCPQQFIRLLGTKKRICDACQKRRW